MACVQCTVKSLQVQEEQDRIVLLCHGVQIKHQVKNNKGDEIRFNIQKLYTIRLIPKIQNF